MIWDGLAKAWQKANREAKEARAVREAEDKKQTEIVEITIVKIKKKK